MCPEVDGFKLLVDVVPKTCVHPTGPDKVVAFQQVGIGTIGAPPLVVGLQGFLRLYELLEAARIELHHGRVHVEEVPGIGQAVADVGHGHFVVVGLAGIEVEALKAVVEVPFIIG